MVVAGSSLQDTPVPSLATTSNDAILGAGALGGNRLTAHLWLCG